MQCLVSKSVLLDTSCVDNETTYITSKRLIDSFLNYCLRYPTGMCLYEYSSSFHGQYTYRHNVCVGGYVECVTLPYLGLLCMNLYAIKKDLLYLYIQVVYKKSFVTERIL